MERFSRHLLVDAVFPTVLKHHTVHGLPVFVASNMRDVLEVLSVIPHSVVVILGASVHVGAFLLPRTLFEYRQRVVVLAYRHSSIRHCLIL